MFVAFPPLAAFIRRLLSLAHAGATRLPVSRTLHQLPDGRRAPDGGWAAGRHVEFNPVAAKMVRHAEDWRWSSARSHLAGKRVADDPLTDVAALGRHVRNWRAMLRHGLEAGGIDAASEEVAAAIEARLRTGRPLAAEEWIADQEAALARKLAPAKRGPKPKVLTGNWYRAPESPNLVSPNLVLCRRGPRA